MKLILLVLLLLFLLQNSSRIFYRRSSRKRTKPKTQKRIESLNTPIGLTVLKLQSILAHHTLLEAPLHHHSQSSGKDSSKEGSEHSNGEHSFASDDFGMNAGSQARRLKKKWQDLHSLAKDESASFTSAGVKQVCTSALSQVSLCHCLPIPSSLCLPF